MYLLFILSLVPGCQRDLGTTGTQSISLNYIIMVPGEVYRQYWHRIDKCKQMNESF